MKLPEWIMSTPRLLAVLLTLTACYGFIVDKIGATEFLSLASLALAFFFQQRKPENQTEPVKKDEAIDQEVTDDELLALKKLSAHDNTNQ